MYTYIYIYIYIYIHLHVLNLVFSCVTFDPALGLRGGELLAYCLSFVYGRFPKFHRVFLGRDPGTLKSDIVSNKTSTINLFGFETQIENSKTEIMEPDRISTLSARIMMIHSTYTYYNYTYMCVYTYIHMCIYIYIYRNRYFVYTSISTVFE